MIRKVHELLFNFENFTIIFVFILKTLLAFKVLQQSPLASIPKLECFHWCRRDLSQLLLRTVLMGDNGLLPSSQGKSYNPFPRDKDLGTIPSPDDKIVSFCSQKYLFSALIRYNHISRPSLFFYPGQEINKKECSKQIVCSFRGRAGRAFCCSLLDFQSKVAVGGSPAGPLLSRPGAAGSGSGFRVWLARGCTGKLPRVSENEVDSSGFCVRKVFFQLRFRAHQHQNDLGCILQKQIPRPHPKLLNPNF